MAKQFTDEMIKIILELHNNKKTPVEISKIVKATPNGIRTFLKRNSIIPNSIPKRDRSRQCVVCSIMFVPSHNDGIKKDGCKTCSKPCLKKLFASYQIKYTQEQIERVIELKKQNLTNNTISNLTEVSISKIKEIVKKNKLYLSAEQIQKNAHNGRINKETTVFSYEKYNEIINLIEKDIIDGRGTAHGLAIHYGLNPNSVTGVFRRKGKNNLLGIKESTAQKFIYEFVCEKLGKENILYNDRLVIKPKEIDIYVPSKNLGIEYCGLHWHTENKVGKNAHYEKMKIANEKGVRLITIFGHEWNNREKQVKNFLKSVLSLSTNIVAARKTEIKIIDKSIGKQFVNENHIQGSTNTNLVYFGIFSKELLMGVLSLGRHHRGSNNSIIVLDRLCFLDNFTIQGGASKLLKYAVEWAKQNGYSKIISWSDNRWSEGNVYKKMGFILEEELKPDYFYTKDRKVFSKQSLKKTNEEKKSGKTEKELRLNQGYERIYDCGKKRWIFNIT